MTTQGWYPFNSGTQHLVFVYSDTWHSPLFVVEPSRFSLLTLLWVATSWACRFWRHASRIQILGENGTVAGKCVVILLDDDCRGAGSGWERKETDPIIMVRSSQHASSNVVSKKNENLRVRIEGKAGNPIWGCPKFRFPKNLISFFSCCYHCLRRERSRR